MATPISDLRVILRREINVPGFEQLPDITNTELDGYISDAFWEARLMGMLDTYSSDGTNIFATSDNGDLPEMYQQLVSIVAGIRMIRLKLFNLAINIRAQAGPTEFEQQASATTLRAIFKSMEDRLKALLSIYSDQLGATATYYFDSTLQRESAVVGGYMELQVF